MDIDVQDIGSGFQSEPTQFVQSFGTETWQEVADRVLCSSSGNAQAVRDALRDLNIASSWFVTTG